MVAGPLLSQSFAIELAARGLRQVIAEHDLLRGLGRGQDCAAVTQQVVDVDGGARAPPSTSTTCCVTAAQSCPRPRPRSRSCSAITCRRPRAASSIAKLWLSNGPA